VKLRRSACDISTTRSLENGREPVAGARSRPACSPQGHPGVTLGSHHRVGFNERHDMPRMLVFLSLGLAFSAEAQAQPRGGTTLPVGNVGASAVLPTGQFITPLAAPGSTIQVLSTGLRADGDADAAQAVKTALSPDGRTLLVLTSGWNRDNRLPDGAPLTYPGIDPVTGADAGQTTRAEWVFVYRVERDGSVTKQQQLNLPSTYSGLVWGSDATRFYVSGGANDRVYGCSTRAIPTAICTARRRSSSPWRLR
jgi:hypothetical protein